MKGLRAITLWQPWASLLAAAIKQNETRGWDVPAKVVGTVVAIHAAVRFEVRVDAGDVLTAGLARHHAVGSVLPTGAVLGVCRFAAGVPTDVAAGLASDEERAMGDFSAGRFAWPAHDVVMLAAPVPCIGAQGFWYVPEAVAAEVRARVLAARPGYKI